MIDSKPAIGFVAVETSRTGEYAGRSPTLPQMLGVFLRELEERHGPRDRDWTILGVEFLGETPRTVLWEDVKQVVVSLHASAASDTATALYTLAHEAVHLLAPPGRATVIEEGLAVLYSMEIGDRFSLNRTEAGAEYIAAAVTVAELLDTYPDAIRRIRTLEPSFANLTPKTIMRALPDLDPHMAARLCESFGRWRAAA